MAMAAGKMALAAAKAKRPNILYIMSDDHTAQAIGAYGSRLAKLNPTPVIDTLAAEGMRLDRVFCNNSICTPSRASIITGQYCQTNGVLDLPDKLPPEKAVPADRDGQGGLPHGDDRQVAPQERAVRVRLLLRLPGPGAVLQPGLPRAGRQALAGTTRSRRKASIPATRVTDITLDWLKTGWDKSKPFFLMHHFKAPHDMFENAPRYDTYLEDVEIPEPPNLCEPLDGSVATRGYGSGIDQGPGRLESRPGTWASTRTKVAEPEYSQAVYQRYPQAIPAVRQGRGRQRQAPAGLPARDGELDNTVIFYTGDQGYLPRRARLDGQAMDVRGGHAHAAARPVSQDDQGRARPTTG